MRKIINVVLSIYKIDPPKALAAAIIFILAISFPMYKSFNEYFGYSLQNAKYLTVDQAIKEQPKNSLIVLTDAQLDCSKSYLASLRDWQYLVAIKSPNSTANIIGIYQAPFSCQDMVNKPVSGVFDKLAPAYSTNYFYKTHLRASLGDNNAYQICNLCGKSNSFGVLIIEGIILFYALTL